MPSSFGLVVQRLPQQSDKVLTIAHLSCERSADKWASTSIIGGTFDQLRIPRPGNISQSLAGLQKKELVVRRAADKTWAITPVGKEYIRTIIGQLDLTSIEREISLLGGAELSQTQHPTIPPELAPVRWSHAIQQLLDKYEFDSNVFCMTRFPKDETEGEYPDPIKKVLETTREVLKHHGLNLHLASDRNADDELFGNIAGHMWACKYGIGLFETRFGNAFNDNLQIEVGAMLITGRRVALLKDKDTPDMPTDFVGHIYKSVDFEDTAAVAAVLHSWIADDLALGRCPYCPAD